MGEIGEMRGMGEGGGIKVLPELTLKIDDLGEDVENEDVEDADEAPEDEI